MKLTPVRVRGKNKGRRRQKQDVVRGDEPPALNRPRAHPQTRAKHPSGSLTDLRHPRLVKMQPKAKTTAKVRGIEKLPVELLQSIFFLCPNLNLPLASPYIYSALSSVQVKAQLVMQNFGACICKRDTEDYYNLRRDLKYCNDSHSAVDDKNIISTLLKQKWLTYRFFKECQKKYLVRNAERELRAFAPGATSDSHVAKMVERFELHLAVAGREAFFQKACSMRSEDYDSKYADAIRGRFEYANPDGSTFAALLHQALCPSDLEFAFVHELQVTIKSSSGLLFTSIYRMPARAIDCQIPEKLLHGPWHKERGDFLKLLLDAGASVDWSGSTSGEVASKGLEDALREGNYHALIALGTGDPRVTQLTDIDQLYFPEEELENFDFATNEWRNYQQPWKSPSGIPWDSVRPVGVVPTQEHLKIAILEKGCDLKVLARLMYTGNDINFSGDVDPELFSWAQQDRSFLYVEGRDENLTKGEIFLNSMDNRGFSLRCPSLCEIRQYEPGLEA